MGSKTQSLDSNPTLPTDLKSDQGKSHNDLKLNIFNCKTDINPVSPPRAVKLQGNAYLGLGVGVFLEAFPCMKVLQNWVLLILWVRVKYRAWEPNGTGQGRGQKKRKKQFCVREGSHLLSRSQSCSCTKGLGVAQSDVNAELPTAGMEPSWQEPSLWSSLQCDVVLLHVPHDSIRQRALGTWRSIKPQMPESQNDTRTNNIENYLH